MDYGVLTYNFGRGFNVGDYIQSLAARQFLPQVDQYICREELREYDGPQAKVIMNGWYMAYPEHWPPSPNIIPLFIAFHINIEKAEGMLTEEGIAYLKKHEPIGCRDSNTVKILEEKGIRSYFSGCLTLTLGRNYHHTANEDIFIVDALYRYPTKKTVFKSFNSLRKSIKTKDIFLLGKREKLLRRILGDSIVQEAKEITHVYSADEFPTEEGRFELADNLMKRYEKAKLVVTSRIHCALPCLAIGTPVIFLDGGFQQTYACRFGGIMDLFHSVNVSENDDITANFDLDTVKNTKMLEPKKEHVKHLDALQKQCENFINNTTS